MKLYVFAAVLIGFSALHKEIEASNLSKSTSEPLYKKCASGDLHDIEQIEKATKEELMGEDEDGRGGFHYLVHDGYMYGLRDAKLALRIMGALRGKGIDIHKKDKLGRTALHLLAGLGCYSSGATLLTAFLQTVKPENMAWEDYNGDTPLYELFIRLVPRVFIASDLVVWDILKHGSSDELPLRTAFEKRVDSVKDWLRQMKKLGKTQSFQGLKLPQDPEESLMQKYLMSFDPSIDSDCLYMTQLEKEVQKKYVNDLTEKTPREFHLFLYPYKKNGMVVYTIGNLGKMALLMAGQKRNSKKLFKDLNFYFNA